MRPTLYSVDLESGGRVSTMAKPRGGDWLGDEMTALARDGVQIVVSTLSGEEVLDLDLGTERNFCESAGMRFVAIPIPDRSVPEAGSVASVLTELVGELEAGRHVVAHCRFGIGRSSLIAASLLALSGVAPEDAWEQLAAARGRCVPDTDEQRRWVDRFHPGAGSLPSLP